MKTGYIVGDAMTQNPISCSPDKNLVECAKIMAQKHIGGMLVTKGEKLVGLLSEQDIVRKVIAKGENPAKKKVKDVMVTRIKTISPEKDIYDALIIMRDLNIRHLPIVNGKNRLIGLLTIKDILKIQPQLFELLVDKFELREERRKPIYKQSEDEGICQLCGNYAQKTFTLGNTVVCEKCKKSM